MAPSQQQQQSAHKRDELTDLTAATETSGSCPDSQKSSLVTHIPPGRGHILVVEDDVRIRSMLVDLLSDAGCRHHQVQHHEIGLMVAKPAECFDTGANLGDAAMSGWEFLSRSRELDQLNAPVIILSAIDGRSDYPSLLGATAWFTKPLDIPRFLGVVEQMASGTGKCIA